MYKLFWVVGLLLLTSLTFAKEEIIYKGYTAYTPLSVFKFFPSPPLEKEEGENIPIISHFINWTEQNYFIVSQLQVLNNKNSNFIVDSIQVKEEKGKVFRSKIYKDLSSLLIDKDLSIARLISLSPEFQSLFFNKLSSPEFVEGVAPNHTKVIIYTLFPFIGQDGLINMVIKSHFYRKEEAIIKPVTPYIANSYNTLVIEARNIDLSPSLFPSIYTYDENNELKLVYSFDFSNKKEITQNGYVQFIKSEKELVKDPKNFYVSALGAKGEEKTDIIISRNNYLKFFASEEATQNLSKGHFIIIVH